MKTKYLYLSLVGLFLLSCEPTRSLMERGLYEKAFTQSLRRLSDGKVKLKQIVNLEVSFKKLNERDEQDIQLRKSQGQALEWPAIHNLYMQLRLRQKDLLPVMRRLDGLGYKLMIDWVLWDKEIKEATDNTALYYYTEAQNHLIAARKGDRLAARQAYEHLNNCQVYRPDYKDAAMLLPEAEALGITNIRVIADDQNQDLQHKDWHRMLSERMLNLKKLEWKAFYLEDDPVTDIHFDCFVRWDGIYVSSDETISTDCTQSKEVEDGYVMKKEWSVTDSAFVDVKKIQYKTITGTVTNFEQKKSASLELRYRVVDLSTSMLIQSDAIGGSDSWSNTYSKTSGDTNALDGSCSSSIGFCAIFPGDDNMLDQAVNCTISRFYALVSKRID